MLTVLVCLIPDPCYFPSHCAHIIYDGEVIGEIGILHPEVVTAFDLSLPVAAVEVNIEKFL